MMQNSVLKLSSFATLKQTQSSFGKPKHTFQFASTKQTFTINSKCNFSNYISKAKPQNNTQLFKSTLTPQPFRSFCTDSTPATEDFTKTPTHKKINDLVNSNKLVLFMKGTPDYPQCGFSRAVVQVFNALGVEDFAAYDVLADPELREGIKKFSNWPTIPQVYLNSEFIGGCDITISLFKSGELQKMFEEGNIKLVEESK